MVRAGLFGCPADAVAAVRTAIGHMDGAGWIDVEAHSYPRHLGEWVVLYRPGRDDRPETPEWRTLQQKVEQTALAALEIAGAWS
jgi:hypothetical protein